MQSLGFRGFIVLLCVAVFASACKKDMTESTANTGVSKQSWKAQNGTLAAGQSLLYSFVAGGNWTAESDSPAWCKITTPSGGSGINMLRISTEPNTTGAPRTAIVTLRVSGFPVAVKIKITQTAKDGDYTEVNKWVEKYMKETYLWNEAVADLVPDYSLNYNRFLSHILTGVAAKKDAQGRDLNYDDGHWKNGVRERFYSYIMGPSLLASSSLAASATRASDVITDTGLWRVRAVKLNNADKTESVYGFSIYGVAPGTSADKAGLRRGLFITQVDGQTVTTSNYLLLQERLYRGTSVRVVPNTVVWDASGAYKSLNAHPEVTITSATYTESGIYKSSVADVGGRKVAYLLYMGFETADDAALIAVFAEFKRQGAQDLILDLRHNGGGAVRSSTVLGTLIAGDAHKDKIYCKMTYNTQRTIRGDRGVYKIGSSKVPDGAGNYAPIADALTSALNLDRLFVICTESTASASELVINGMKGIDIDVYLLGTTTNGKNVGMEGYKDYEIQGVSYTFMPITFYSENAKEFKDYSDGFDPDVVMNDVYFPGDFGTTDDILYSLAAQWIRDGKKPSTTIRPQSRAVSTLQLLDQGPDRPSRHASGSLVFRNK